MSGLNEATRRQHEAADPMRSTWLAANAGSGKTRVLTDRVARLLFDGVLPQHILCLTYTKAAASEMQNRLFQRLGGWAMLGDEALRRELASLGLTQALSTQELRDARTLFARAIETPGGLKIQTIHSFCASLLRRFPLEADVSPQFAEMEDRAAELLRADVLEQMTATDEIALVQAMSRSLTSGDFGKLTKMIVNRKALFAEPLTREGALRLIGQGDDIDTQGITPLELTGAERSMIEHLAEHLESFDGKTDQATRDALLAALRASDPYGPLRGWLLVDHGGVRKRLVTNAVVQSAPELTEQLTCLAERVALVRETRLALGAAEASAVLSDFARAFLRRYEAEKARRGWLDFDDLIGKARALLSDRAVAAWVLYRIDGGIDHILVDEAQDTSPAQWDVIWKLAEEFGSGEGARPDVRRTIFVVGDQKQSIYSFQGADPREFGRMRTAFDDRLQTIGQSLLRTSLDHSFRSSEAVLRLVDTIFEGRVSSGFSDASQHIAFHDALPGRVDLWPILEPEAKKDDRNWFDPVDQTDQAHHNRQLALNVAAEIKRMVDDKVLIPEKVIDGVSFGRPARPRDFLILVRRRSGVFPEMIRACKELGVPIAGVDVLRVGEEIAVRDIRALLSFLATPGDDLSLATILRSPFFGWSEDQLFRLAHGRGKQSLWQRLRETETEAVSVLRDLRGQADFLRPYDLIERILTRHKGRQKLLGRLGTEAEDGIDALLTQAMAYERSAVPSLTGFLAWMETDDLEVKRQIDSASDQVRIMTVHGAKGLEAPIVILPDTAQRADKLPEFMREADGQALWASGGKERPGKLLELDDTARVALREESLRLLYVALTRAEKWLIVAGAGQLSKDWGRDWYQMISDGMEASGAVQVQTQAGPIRRVEFGNWQLSAMDQPQPDAVAAPELPAFFDHPPDPEPARIETLSPSDLGGAKALPGEGLETEEALAYGSLVHDLLDRLPRLDADGQQSMLEDLRAGATLSGSLIDAGVAEAQAALRDPVLEAYLGPDALAEVGVSADLGERRLHGSIDRLLVQAETVTALDFKSNRVVPTRVEEIPEGILRQLGAYAHALAQIYPGREIRTVIYWSRTGALMHVPHEIVTQALRRGQYLDVPAAPS